jgi:peptidyl-prolyl cis-trans isomerase D
MALINKLREKMGRVVAFAIGFAILSFILADLMGPSSFIMGGNNRNIGEIAGETITLDEYQAEIEALVANYTMNLGRNPSEQEMATLRDQAWELLIVKHAFQKQYEKIGLDVHEDEVVDMVQGKNVSPAIQQAFVNPETGDFDKQRLLAYLQQIKGAPQQQQYAWYLFEKDLKPSRLRLKYENLLMKSTYITTEEAKKNYENQTAVAEIKYLYVPYYSVNDSLVSVTDKELETYLGAHSAQYQAQESRSFQYVTIPIEPSSDDTTYFREEIEELIGQIKNIEDDSVFAIINSDGLNPFREYRINELPGNVASRLDELEERMVIGPIFEGTAFKLFKITSISEDTTFKARVSHILFKWEEESPEEKAKARKEAQDVLNQLQNGENFEILARLHSKDNSASRGGDLGWGTKGQTWVAAFEAPVFNQKEGGLINRIVESEFGFHIIKVTEPANNQIFKIATISKEVIASDETIEKAFRRAGLFQSSITDYDEFVSKAKADSITLQTATGVTPNQRNIPGLGQARVIVQWLYNTAKVGSISDVFELEGTYVVAVMTSRKVEGTSTLNDVRTQVSLKVKNKKKADIIMSKLSETSGTLDEMATAYGSDAVVHSSSDLKLNTNFLPSVGLAPEAIGKTFTLQGGERTIPIPTENGVVIVEMINFTLAGEIADYTTYKTQMKQGLTSGISYGLSETIKKQSDIKDERYKFY